MKKIGAEIDMVVPDSLYALELYKKIFDIEPIEATEFSLGENEVVFALHGVRFHMLDENPQFQLIAPKPDDPKPIWFNITVPDIEATYTKALNEGCTEIQPVTEMAAMGLSNAIFSDPFGYIWMLHQVHREVSFEERTKLWEERTDEDAI
jgi:PhnB protein